jgi:phosphatidylglycerol:prolipoprotein diacylglycerol transferase
MLPILFQNHNLVIYTYPLFMGVAWGVGYQIFFNYLEDSFPPLKAQFLFWGIFICSWIGSKIFYLKTARLSHELIIDTNFWLGGGLVFYGGLAGGLIYLLLFKFLNPKIEFKSIWPLLPALSIGHGIGRIGCFLAGCCYGEKTDWQWGVFQHGEYRHPTQLLEACFLFLFSFYALRICTQKKDLFVHYFITYGLVRMFLESLRGDPVRGLWGGFSPSTWVSLGLTVAGVVLLLISNFRHLKKSS